MVNIAVFASGNGTNFQALIDAIKKREIDGEIKILFIDKKKAIAKERAENNNIPWLYIGKKKFLNKNEKVDYILENLEKYNIDLIVLAGFLEILDGRIIEKFKKKIINIHPSLIPKYCGKGFYGIKVHEAVIKNKDEITGVTVHFVDEGIDTGEIITKKIVGVEKDDTPEILSKRVLAVEHQLLVSTIKDLIGRGLIDESNN